jgi:class 3 adenylate cyclase
VPAYRRGGVALPIVLTVAGLGLNLLALVGSVLLWPAPPAGIVRFSVSSAYTLAGGIAWYRRPDYLLGPLMVLGGLLALLPVLTRFPDNGALFAIGSAIGGVHEVVLAFAILGYPSGKPAGRVNGPAAITVLLLGFGLALADLVTRDTTQPPCIFACATEPNPFLIVDLGGLAVQVGRVVGSVMALVVLTLVARRYLKAAGAARRVLTPVVAATVIAASLVAVRALAFGDLAQVSVAAQVLVPIALGVGFLRSRMARAGVADLVLNAGRAPTLHSLEAAVRSTLHDPTVQLGRWSNSVGDYVDRVAAPMRLDVGPDRQLTLIDGSRGPLAAMLHDPVLAEEGTLLPSVVAAVRVVLENEALATSLQAQTADISRLPRGRVTLLYSDIEGSTELLDALREGYAPLLSEVRRLQRAAVRAAGGTEIDSRADEFFAAIPDHIEAVRAAAAIQINLASRSWADDRAVRLRIGLHTGKPDLTSEGYVGMDIHVAARIGASAHGGQIVLSDSTKVVVAEPPDGFEFRDLGRYRLKGVPVDVRLHQLETDGLSKDFPPLRATPA